MKPVLKAILQPKHPYLEQQELFVRHVKEDVLLVLDQQQNVPVVNLDILLKDGNAEDHSLSLL